MDSSDPTPPALPQGAPIPPPTRKRRTVSIITLTLLALLLLAAFMVSAFLMTVTTAEVVQVDEDIELPVSESAPSKKVEIIPEEYSLNLRWENGKGVFRFMDKDYEDDQALIAELVKLKANIPHAQIMVRGDKRLPAMEIQHAMRVLSAAGFDSINFTPIDQK